MGETDGGDPGGPSGTDDAGDPFDFSELRLDEDFVRGAAAHELSAEDRIRQARRIAIHEDVLSARRRHQKRESRPHRRAIASVKGAWQRRPRLAPGRGRGRQGIGLVVVLALVGGAWLYTAGGGTGAAGRRDGTGPLFGADDPVARAAASDARPTPQQAASATRLEVAPQPPADTGPYQFIATQEGSAAPVRYDPCRTISIVVNNRTLPKGAVAVFNEALLMVSRATGLRFRVEGTTDEPPTDRREAFDEPRYGDRWSPVLVAWSDADEYEGVKGSVVGEAGSNWVDIAGLKTRVYVSGQVVFDGPDMRALFLTDVGRAQARAVMIHELAHLVGLDHVDDDSSIMAPETGSDLIEFAAGDLHGLVALGAGPCIPLL